jgi:hypothetical protein
VNVISKNESIFYGRYLHGVFVPSRRSLSFSYTSNLSEGCVYLVGLTPRWRYLTVISGIRSQLLAGRQLPSLYPGYFMTELS